jgi:hypothetical protein
MSAAASNDSADWDDRRLCVDDLCVGVLAPSGRCPVCGKHGEAVAGSKASSAPAAVPVIEVKPVLEPVKQAAALTEVSDDLDDRELCPDGACIGVLGASGRCKLCGKSA